MKFKGNILYLTEDTFIELKVVKTNISEGYFDELVSVETLVKIHETILQNKFENILAEIVRENGIENPDGSITWFFDKK